MVRRDGALLLTVLLIGCGPTGVAMSPAAAAATSVPAALALPVAIGRVGPDARATVTLRRTGSEEGGGFAATLEIAGRRVSLSGPDEPRDFFIVEPKSVIFTPVDAFPGNGIVILYDSSRIGPGHGTDRKALVYRVYRHGVARLPQVEARLDGAADAAAVGARLRARR